MLRPLATRPTRVPTVIRMPRMQGFPVPVENTRDSGPVRFARALQSIINFTAASDSGISRSPAAVLGVLNAPS